MTGSSALLAAPVAVAPLVAAEPDLTDCACDWFKDLNVMNKEGCMQLMWRNLRRLECQTTGTFAIDV